jgi:hypothetical protein
MTLDDFRASLEASVPPAGLRPALRALWHDARGDWDEAHHIAQGIEDRTGAWVHAYLHRREGDPANADYWYQRAGQPACSGPLDREWIQIVLALLQPE